MQDFTRPPDDKDLVFIANELNRLGAKYIVIGGVAINRLGFIRATEDLDLLISKDYENQVKVKKALSHLPDNAISELGDDDISQWVVVRVNDEITIDLMTEATGIKYEEAISQVDIVSIEGVAIPFANPELMLRFKNTCREKDAIDKAYLLNLLKNDEH